MASGSASQCGRMIAVPLPKAPVLRELLKFVVVVPVAGAVGLGLGIGLNQVFGITKPSRGGAVAATPPTAEVAPGSTTAPSRSAAALDLGRGLTLRVDSASFVAASKAAGRALNRSRITVKAAVINGGQTAVTPPVLRLTLQAAGITLRPDRRAFEIAGPLVRRLAPGGVAAGQLNFEATRAATTALERAKEVVIGYRSGRLTVAVG